MEGLIWNSWTSSAILDSFCKWAGLRKAESHTWWGLQEPCSILELQNTRGHRGPQGPREAGGTVFKSDFPCTKIFFQLLPAHTSLPSQAVLPPHTAAQKCIICICQKPRTGWQKIKNNPQTSLVIPAFLLLSPLTPKPFAAHSSFSGSPQICSPDFKRFTIQSNTDKVPPVGKQD